MTNRIIKPGQTIGIIGGGQLGKMMALDAKAAGFRVVILEPVANSPAGQVADEEIIATYDDQDALALLAEKSDVITYEFENIDYEALHWLTEKAYIPQGAELIRVTQDRILEKQMLTDAKVQVAPYQVIETKEQLQDAVTTIGFPSVLKTARGGYDGKGQFVLKQQKDLDRAGELLSFGPCVLEAWIPFDKEISVVMTRSTTGELTYFPVGENVHINNILHTTVAPARIPLKIEQEVHNLAQKIANHLQLVGTLAVEMFLTKDDEIFVNELAPRPHNSGHYTIEACTISQFGQHIRAVCGWPLREVTLLKPAIMVNILGQHVPGVIEEISNKPNWAIHFYGKEEAKQNRKMGHITILTEDIEATINEIQATNIWNQ